MPYYYFDIKDGHRLVDPSGSDFKNDDAAIAEAKLIAIEVSLDKPAVDRQRHICCFITGRNFQGARLYQPIHEHHVVINSIQTAPCIECSLNTQGYDGPQGS